MIQHASDTSYLVLQELRVAREVARAFLTAEQPLRVYQLALERVAPIVGANFGCVFLRVPDDSELLHVAAAHNWPDAYTAYLDGLRVRIGNGPTGRAVARDEMVVIPDIFADPDLEDWWEPARELGFSSSAALPLSVRGEIAGALTFYFSERESLGAGDTSLLRLVADQLSATVEKAQLIEDLQQANARLRSQYVELEARYRQAEEARRLKTEFLSNISHELRTPLNAILGYTFLLKEADKDWSEEGPELGKIESAAGSLLGLINDLLDLTQLKLGRTTIRVEASDAAALGRAAFDNTAWPTDDVVRSIDAPEEELPLVTDPIQVIRILEILLANAAKFTVEGSVTLRIRPGEGEMSWAVEDTGIGIAPHFQEAIFDEFRQADGSATRAHGGAGLGLALARKLARRLGGELSLNSVSHEGSTFTLTLPLDPPVPVHPEKA